MSAAVPKPGRNMGPAVPRVDGRAKVTGAARYASDEPVSNPAFAYLVTSSIAKGRITSIGDKAVLAMPGVRLVMTHANRPKLGPVKFFLAGGPGLTGVPPLDGPAIRHEGQIIALIVADSFEIAREAAHRLDIGYARETPAAVWDAPGIVTQRTSDVLKERKDTVKGDAAAALAGSAVTLEAAYSTPVQHHNSIEMLATTAHWEGDTLKLYEPSQFVYGLRAGLAAQLGMPPEKIHVHNAYVGGAFGGKGALGHRTALVALAAKQLGRPVKLVATRDQGFTISGHRHETRHRVKLGAAQDGRLTGYSHDLDELNGRDDPYVNMGIENTACMYAFPAVASVARMMRADRNTPTFMRSPPEVPAMFALECAMDELAEKLGMDPVRLRQLNDTRVNPVNGAPYSSRSLNQCFDIAAKAFGWAKKRPNMRDGDWLIGYGCATASYPTNVSPAVVRVTLTADGAARVQIAAHDVGTGAYTVAAQEAGARLGVPIERVSVELGDSRLPPGPVSGGSCTTASVCSAIMIGCDKVLAKLQLTGAAPMQARAAAFKRLGLASVEELGEFVPPTAKEPTTASLYKGSADISGGAGDKRTAFAFGAEFVEVRVHRLTREIRVPRITGAFAAGRIMNPRTAHSQLMGGMIWGIGSALHEFTEVDPRHASYINDNLAEYLIPVNADIAAVEVILVPEDDDFSPSGAKGLGELGNVGTAAAIANAVYHATGKRIRDLPITIDKLI